MSCYGCYFVEWVALYNLTKAIMANKKSNAAIRIAVPTRTRLDKLLVRTESGVYLESYDSKIIHLMWLYEKLWMGKTATC